MLDNLDNEKLRQREGPLSLPSGIPVEIQKLQKKVQFVQNELSACGRISSEIVNMLLDYLNENDIQVSGEDYVLIEDALARFSRN